MPSYKLLRSNKESGPYSLDDLVTLGLKPYDLIWVDGRSAAWRYPSEVPELKDFAPAVEEQPYDRFYKKSSESDKVTEAPANELVASQREPIAAQRNSVKDNLAGEQINQKPYIDAVKPPFEVKKEEPVKIVTPEIPASTVFPPYQPQPKKKIFVSMPETNTFEQSPDRHQDKYEHDKYQQYLPKPKSVQKNAIPQEKPVPAEERAYSPIDIHESEEAKLETKYTQSLDDIKDMYINTLVQRKTKNKRKEILRKYIKPALLPLLLVLSGVAIGFVINNRKSSPRAIESASTIVPQQQAAPQEKSDEKPAENKVVPANDKQDLAVTADTKKKKTIPPKTEVVIKSHKQNKTTVSVPKAVAPERRGQQQHVFVPDDEIASTLQKRNVEVDPSTGERKKVIRDNDQDARQNEVTDNNLPRPGKKNNSERSFIEADRRNIRDFVSVRSNSYIRGPFGGIRGLELTVYNKSGFMLDEVSVELQIMKPSEQPLRTDIITFKNIAANGAVTVRVPDSQRGIRVDYRITNVASKQWEKSTAGL